MTSKNLLFFVSAKNDDGESLDLFVVSPSKPEAGQFWREHFELDAWENPERISIIPGVTPTREVGPIGWDEINID